MAKLNFEQPLLSLQGHVICLQNGYLFKRFIKDYILQSCKLFVFLSVNFRWALNNKKCNLYVKLGGSAKNKQKKTMHL